MSSNRSTMPRCVGSMQPSETWIKKELTCEDCAWEEYCIDYFDANDMMRDEEAHSIEVLEPQDFRTA